MHCLCACTYTCGSSCVIVREVVRIEAYIWPNPGELWQVVCSKATVYDEGRNSSHKFSDALARGQAAKTAAAAAELQQQQQVRLEEVQETTRARAGDEGV